MNQSSAFLISTICFMSLSFSISEAMNWCRLLSLGQSISNETLRSSLSISSFSSSGSSRNSATLRWPSSIILVWCTDENWPTCSNFEDTEILDKLSLVLKKVSFSIPIRQMMPKKMSSLVSLLLRVSEKTLLLGFVLVSWICFLSFSFSSLALMSSSSRLPFFSSSSLKYCFFRSLETWAETLFLFFLISASVYPALGETGIENCS
jgi:hypothetical protein